MNDLVNPEHLTDLKALQARALLENIVLIVHICNYLLYSKAAQIDELN